MSLTTNYSFDKSKWGHQVVDNDIDRIAANLDLIDAAIKARETEIDALEALADGKILVGNGDGVAADVAMSGDVTIANTGATVIGADKVTNTMLANITQGSMKVGGASDAPTDLDAKTDAQILVGDGTDINSVAVSGDITIDNAGTITIGADKVTNTKLANITQGSVKVGGASDVPTDLDAKTDAQMLIGDGTDINSVAISGDVTIDNAGATTIGANKVGIAELAATLQKGVLSIGPLLQEDALNFTVYFPFKVTVNKVRSFLTVVLATANSVITMKKHDGTSMTDGTLTITSTGSVGDEDSCSPSALNVIDADEKMTLAIDGGASAGEAIFFIEYTRTA